MKRLLWKIGNLGKRAINLFLAPLGVQISRRRRVLLNEYDDMYKEAFDGVSRPLVIDIGAHVGETIDHFVKCAPGATILAFEPSPESFSIMSERWAGVGITCINMALGERNEEMEFNVYNGSVTDSLLSSSAGRDEVDQGMMKLKKKVKVSVRRLDDVLQEQGLAGKTIDLLKIDVQGFEDRVLRGALQTLDRVRYVLIEVHLNPVYEGSCLVDQLCYILYGKGFRLQRSLGCLMAERIHRPISTDFLFKKI